MERNNKEDLIKWIEEKKNHKFNILDKVYGIFYEDMAKNSYWRVIDLYVYSIEINYNGDIVYGNKFKMKVEEQDCFATKEEAQKECDRRNGNKGTQN